MGRDDISFGSCQGNIEAGSIDPFLAKLLVGCNGRNKLADLIPILADILEGGPAAVAPELCAVVRRLVEQGSFLPAESCLQTSCL